MDGAFDSLDRLRAAPIASTGGRFVQLGDVAMIQRAEVEPTGSYALYNGERTILVAGYLEPGIQVSAWDRRAQAAVADFAAVNPGVEVTVVFAQAEYVVDRLAGLAVNLGFSALIVFGVLFLMMGWRAALITGSALPLTVLLVILLINISGEPLHQMSVTGLVVALGLLIDNAIVVVDDYRLLRARGMERLEAVDKAVKTLFGPLLASTLTTIFAFAPIALMPGTAGEFIGMIGTSVIFAVASSFVLAFTVIIALAAWFDDGRAGEPDQPWWRDGLRSKPLAWAYRKALDGVIAQPLLGLVVGVMLPVAGFAAATTLPSQFFPQTERDMFQLRLIGPPASSIEATQARVEAATEALRAYDEIVDISWVLGESGPRVYYNMLAGVSGRPNYAQGFVRTTSEQDTRRIVAEVQAAMREQFPDSQFLALPFEQGPPAPAPIELTLVGLDERSDSEQQLDAGDFPVLVNESDVDRLDGATVDYVERVNESGFEVRPVPREAEEERKPSRSEPQGELAHIAGRADFRIGPVLARRIDQRSKLHVHPLDHLADAQIRNVLHCGGEILPELAQQGLPVEIARRHLVELVF